MKHPAEQYMEDVLAGKIPANKCVMDACKRQQRDLENAHKRNLHFNAQYADHVIWFFSQLKHYKGKYAGQPFILSPWQQFIIWCVFGWRKGSPTGPRRYRYIYIEVPKKNGKTTFMAGITIYTAFFDNEYASDVYTAATKRDQAKIAFKDAKNMVQGNLALKKHIKIQQNSIFNPATESSIHPLSNDQDTSDGINVHCGIIDELHRHKTSEMVDLLEASISARRQPMIWEITTAGNNRQTVCYEHHQYTKEVNAGKKKDDTWFGVVYGLDSGDDYRDPVSWHKANPNLGHGKDVEYLEARVNKARNIPRLENSVRRYEFNEWVGSTEKWISQDIWEACIKKRSEKELLSEEVACFAGLDLGAKRDFNALVLIFHHREKGWKHIKEFYWCPKDAIDKRVEQENIGYNTWVKSGQLKLVPGNVVDPETLGTDIIEICERWNVQSFAYDPYIAAHGTVQRLMKADIEGHEISQGYKHLSEPTKALEAEIYSGKLSHENNPVTGWMMDNVQVYEDANENIKLVKDERGSANKIDGPVAMVMAYAEWLDDSMQEEDGYDDYEVFLV